MISNNQSSVSLWMWTNESAPLCLWQDGEVRVGAVGCEGAVVVQQQTEGAPARAPQVSAHHPGDVRHLHTLHHAAGSFLGQGVGHVLDLGEERVHPVEEIMLSLSGPQGRHPHLGLGHRHGEGAGVVTQSLSLRKNDVLRLGMQTTD